MRFSELTSGLIVHAPPILVTEADIIAFARQYDPQYFHTEPERAAHSRWGGLIASGWHTCALAMRMAYEAVLKGSESFGSPGVSQVTWENPVRPGDWLSLVCEIRDVRRSEKQPWMGILKWYWILRNQRDQNVATLEVVSFFDLSEGSAQSNESPIRT